MVSLLHRRQRARRVTCYKCGSARVYLIPDLTPQEKQLGFLLSRCEVCGFYQDHQGEDVRYMPRTALGRWWDRLRHR